MCIRDRIDGFVTPDLTLIAEHITSGSTITAISYARSPDNLIWVLLADGGLRCLTYEREQDVVAFHRHIPGGTSGSCTVTVSDYANIAAGEKLVLTKSDGSTVTFTCQGAGSSPSPDTNKFFQNESNNTTADNIYTAINLHADFTVANPAAAVVTIAETLRAGADPLTITTTDSTRLAVQVKLRR